jgi:Sec-independent protein translocase protein TatA
MLNQEQQEKADQGAGGFVDSLREIQGEYIMLGELYEKQKSYGAKLSDMMKTLQYEVDTTIPIRPEALGRPCRAAYLVSEGVVVVFDSNGGMTSKPLYTLAPDVIISIIQECTPELQRLLSEKRRAESGKVKSMERVLKELKKAQATFKQTRREEMDVDEDEEQPESEVKPVAEEARPKAQTEPPPQQRGQRDSFAFRGSFGEKQDVASISS